MSRLVRKASYIFQWAQLLTLALVHFFIDLFPGMLPTILPEVRQRFAFTLTMAVAVLTTLNISCNLFQILTGHMRPDKHKPLFMPLGLLLAAGICLMPLLPSSNGLFVTIPMIFLALISGLGVAITHPEGLRGVHNLDKIKPSVSTAVFLTGGFLGFSSGGWISTLIVSSFDLEGLLIVFVFPLIGILLLWVLKIRLAVESQQNNKNSDNPIPSQLPYWPVVIMAIPGAVSTSLIVAFLPTFLDELGFVITFRGFSIMILGFGAAAGSLIWAPVVHKKGELKCSVTLLILGLPFLILYFVIIKYEAAVWLLFATGFFSTSAYSFIVTLARHATGLNLGQRMGFIMGGSWGIASLVVFLLGPVAEMFSVGSVLKFSPCGYILSAIIGTYIVRKNNISQKSILPVNRKDND